MATMVAVQAMLSKADPVGFCYVARFNLPGPRNFRFPSPKTTATCRTGPRLHIECSAMRLPSLSSTTAR